MFLPHSLSRCCRKHSLVHEIIFDPWWRHQMETFSALLAICAGNSPVSGEFPAQRPVTRSFDVFFDLRLSKRLSKQSWGWWIETPSRPLLRQCNAMSRISSKLRYMYLSSNCHGQLLNWPYLKNIGPNRHKTEVDMNCSDDMFPTGLPCLACH